MCRVLCWALGIKTEKILSLKKLTFQQGKNTNTGPTMKNQ